MNATARSLLVGVDPMSLVLAVIDREQAIADTSQIRTLADARTLGEVRRGDPKALAIVRECYEADAERAEDEPFDSLPDDTPYQAHAWFGSDSWYFNFPLARLITEQTVPREILDEFGQPDHAYGLDYEQATWLRPEDSDAIVSRLRELGFEVDDSPEAGGIICDYTYQEA